MIAPARVRHVRAWAVACALVGLTACTAPPVTDAVRTLHEPLPELSGVDLEGAALSTDAFTGSVLVVNAWASWCLPCEEETPMLVEMASRYASHGVRFVGIDHADQVAEGRRFAERYEVSYPSFSDEAGRFAAVLGYPGLPATYVVDGEGTIRYAVYEQIEEATLVRLLDEVLGVGTGAPPAVPAA